MCVTHSRGIDDKVFGFLLATTTEHDSQLCAPPTEIEHVLIFIGVSYKVSGGVYIAVEDGGDFFLLVGLFASQARLVLCLF